MPPRYTVAYRGAEYLLGGPPVRQPEVSPVQEREIYRGLREFMGSLWTAMVTQAAAWDRILFEAQTRCRRRSHTHMDSVCGDSLQWAASCSSPDYYGADGYVNTYSSDGDTPTDFGVHCAEQLGRMLQESRREPHSWDFSAEKKSEAETWLATTRSPAITGMLGARDAIVKEVTDA